MTKLDIENVPIGIILFFLKLAILKADLNGFYRSILWH